MDTCSVCCENYNKSTNKPISCEYGDCEFKSCKSCIRQYLLSTTNDPHCMNCKKAWSQNFLITKLNRSFISNDYKVHRKTLLLDREISKLPETIIIAEKVKKCEIKENEANEIKDKILELKRQVTILNNQYNQCHAEIRNIKSSPDNEEKKKFIMPCPNDNCKGFLSSQYKCELCQLYTCPHCIETIGYNKNEEHKCNEDSVKSAELIKKETRPCPTCGERIFKIDGCDQMWCTSCHSAFSWKTGKIDNGPVHNPHFYQFQRNNNNGIVPRNPAEQPCGGLPGYHLFRQNVLKKLVNDIPLQNNVNDLHRIIGHIIHTCVRETRYKVQTLGNNENLRVEYILNRKTKEELASQLVRNDNSRRKYMELLHIYELLSNIGIELMNNLSNSNNVGSLFITEVKDRLVEYNNLRLYCNKQLSIVSATYNNTVPQFESNWKFINKKFNISEISEISDI